MKFLQETTVWENPVPNNLYVVDNTKSKMIAYLPPGKSEFVVFKKPIGYDTRYRKFVEVPNTFNFHLQEKSVNPTWNIVGSKGDVYTIEKIKNDYFCSCSGFKFHGKCKHIESVK